MLQFNVREPQKNVAVLCLHTDAECCNPKCHIKVKFRSSTCHQNVESFLSAAVLIVIHSSLTFDEYQKSGFYERLYQFVPKIFC